jgi:hypothetical protein
VLAGRAMTKQSAASTSANGASRKFSHGLSDATFATAAISKTTTSAQVPQR